MSELPLCPGSQCESECNLMQRLSLFYCYTEWYVVTGWEHQIPFPTKTTLTVQRPDIVIWAVNSRKVFFVESTNLFEENIDWAHQRKLGKYDDLGEQKQLVTNVFYRGRIRSFHYQFNLSISN